MPRRTDRKQLNAVLSEAQHTTLLTLAGSEGINDYVRRLISEDAAQRGIVWPADLPGPGKYERQHRARTLRDLLMDGMEYSSSWGIWALKQDGKFMPDSPARFGQFVFENGGVADGYELVGNNETLEDMITEQGITDDNPNEREEAVDFILSEGMLD